MGAMTVRIMTPNLTALSIRAKSGWDLKSSPCHAVHILFSSSLIFSVPFIYRSVPIWFPPFKVKIGEITGAEGMNLMTLSNYLLFNPKNLVKVSLTPPLPPPPQKILFNIKKYYLDIVK